MTLGIEREGLGEPLRELAAAGTPIFGTCAGMIMLDREHLGIADYALRAQRVRPPDPLVRGRPADPGDRRRRRCAPCSSARRGSPSTATTSRCSPRSTGTRSRPARATCSSISFHPEIAGETRLHELFLREVAAASRALTDLTLYFVRHGESVANAADRNGDKRPADADRLSDRGWEQARGLGRRLAGRGPGADRRQPDEPRAGDGAGHRRGARAARSRPTTDLLRGAPVRRVLRLLARLRRHRHAELDADRAARLRRARRGVVRRHRGPRPSGAGAPVARAPPSSGSSRSATTASCTSSSASRCSATTSRPARARALPGRPRQHRHHDLRAPRAPGMDGVDLPGWVLTTWNDQGHALSVSELRRAPPRPPSRSRPPTSGSGTPPGSTRSRRATQPVRSPARLGAGHVPPVRGDQRDLVRRGARCARAPAGRAAGRA